MEREKRQLETRRDEAWKLYDEAAREIEKQKDALIEQVEKRLEQSTGSRELFTVRWSAV